MYHVLQSIVFYSLHHRQAVGMAISQSGWINRKVPGSKPIQDYNVSIMLALPVESTEKLSQKNKNQNGRSIRHWLTVEYLRDIK